jgi:hypothetical protein
MEKMIDNPGLNVVILIYWRFFEQRMTLKPQEGNSGNYVCLLFAALTFYSLSFIRRLFETDKLYTEVRIFDNL